MGCTHGVRTMWRVVFSGMQAGCVHHGEGCAQWAVNRVCAPCGGLCSVGYKQGVCTMVLCSVGCKQGVCTIGRVVFSGLYAWCAHHVEGCV